MTSDEVQRPCPLCGRMMTSNHPMVWVQSEQTGFKLELHTRCAQTLAEALMWRVEQNDAGNTPDPEELRFFSAGDPR